jgi:hypothetical protein
MDTRYDEFTFIISQERKSILNQSAILPLHMSGKELRVSHRGKIHRVNFSVKLASAS